jgi:hypothetical protein
MNNPTGPEQPRVPRSIGRWLQKWQGPFRASGLTAGGKTGWGIPLHFACQYAIGTEKCR